MRRDQPKNGDVENIRSDQRGVAQWSSRADFVGGGKEYVPLDGKSIRLPAGAEEEMVLLMNPQVFASIYDVSEHVAE